MGRPLRVLFVEDTEDDVRLVLRELRSSGYDIAEGGWARVETAAALAASLRHGPWDIIISDYAMPAFTGPEALALCKERGVEAPFLIVSGTVEEEQAVIALRSGARDFISKSKLARLGPAVARELSDQAERASGRKAEAQLRQAQKMDAVGQLAGGVAHDLNNILGVILGQGELLMRGAELADPQRSRVVGICDAAERAAALVRQLLAFSRRQIVQSTVVRLNVVIGETMKMLERIVGEHIEIKQHLAADLWEVKADVAQVEQVIMNLVINARDAMGSGGRLTVGTRNVSVTSSAIPPPGEYVLLDITDTGCGMDEATVTRIFEPFFTTKEPGKGTGLGLATVYGIVAQAGGYVDVETAPGKGSCFHVYWPRCERAAPETPRAAKAAAVGGSETILLVEDDLTLRWLVREMLEDAGYRVLAPEDVEEAIEISRSYQGPIHALLTDVVLPRMRGPEVARRVKEARPQIQVVYMSGYASSSGEVLSPLLVKPFLVNALLTTIRGALDGPRSGEGR
jgi:two-component system, cell cycle sensor histidine kinase and response regulator CckA